MNIKLINVYGYPNHVEILYELLKERDSTINIHYSELPDFKKHKRFVNKKPYVGWFFIKDDEEICGSVLLDNRKGENEIGVFIFKKFHRKGYATKAVKLLMDRFRNVKKFICFINPKNKKSIVFFKGLGFRHIQNTYEYSNEKGQKIK